MRPAVARHVMRYCDGDLTAFNPRDRSTSSVRMPELPEVETTRRGIEPAVARPRHRARSWSASRGCAGACRASCREQAAGQRVRELRRRAKYLLFDLERGTHDPAPGHVGQPARAAGSDRAVRRTITSTSCSTPACACASTIRGASAACCGRRDDPLQHPLLRSLAPEPLSDEFDGEYLARAAQGRSVAIKQLIMNSQVVVGVGNIYASEALFRAGIRPRRAARSAHARRVRRAGEIDQGRCCARRSAPAARRCATTSIREGMPGYFRQKLFVYERTGEPCRVCRTPIRQFVQGQRSTYFCPQCQK